VFTDITLDSSLNKAIETLGFTEPTPVQSSTIKDAMAGRDLMVGAETGSGKTLAFLLPILHQLMQKPAPRSGTRALILTPTRELAEQVCKVCETLVTFSSIKVIQVCGGEGFKEQSARIRRNPEIIVGTPGRLVEHIERNTLDFKDLECLVLDEADRMLDMGFRDEVLTITDACQAERQTMLFSATLNRREINDLVERVLKDPIQILLSTAQTSSDHVRQQIVLADDNQHKEKELNWLLSNETYDRALVFTNTRVQADHLGGILRYHKHRAAVLHGEMQQPQRRQVLNLLRQNKVKVLVATDVAARGLDIDGIDLVINFDMARSGDEYVHRIGRTARAGKEGLAVTLIAHYEWNLMSSIERYLKTSFERRALPGLKGSYTGPKKVRSSGKAVGKKKEPDRKGSVETVKVKKRLRDQKAIGKRRVPTAEKTTEKTAEKKSAPSVISDGFAPLKKRGTPDAG